MSLLNAIDISATGLNAQRRRVEVAAQNLANSRTTRTDEGGPFRRQDVVFRATSFSEEMRIRRQDKDLQGVAVVGVVEDPSDFQKVYEPGHPDSDAEGYLLLPNVDPMREMANISNASRSYQANLSSISILKTMIQRTIEIAR
jgi:flagellar basal-body rod protein FlgC